MSTLLEKMTALVEGIKATNPQMTDEQARAEAERYVNEAMTPIYSEQEIFEMLDDPQYRRPGVPPRRMPRYTSEERRQRREFSRKLRQELYPTIQEHLHIANKYAYYLNEGGVDPRNNPDLSEEDRRQLEADRRHYSRGVGCLFHHDIQRERFFRENPEATEDDLATAQQLVDLRNEEIAFLFDTNPNHWNAYFAETVPKWRDSDPELANVTDAEIRELIQAELSRKRTDIVMRAMRESLEITEHLTEMTDPGLPPEVLGDNYAKIARAKGLIMDIDADFSNRPDVPLTEAERKQMEQWKKLQGAYIAAHDRIELRTNPIYEIIDPEILIGDCDVSKMNTVYSGYLRETLEGDEFRAERNRRFPELDNYVRSGGKSFSDKFEGLLQDTAATTFYSRDMELEANFQATVTGYGFTLGGDDGAECFCDEFNARGQRRLKDEAGVEELKSGRPLLFRQGERVAVLTLDNPLSPVMTWKRPEALFNYSLAAENTAMLKQIADSDKWYQTRSDNFKHMREAFEALAAEGKTLSDSKQEREALAQRYRDVLKLCDTYLDGKLAEGVGDGHNDLERGHIAAARALNAHLMTKLEEIEFVDKARHDIQKYRNMSAEQVRADIARENKYREKPLRRGNLPNWLDGTGLRYRNEVLPEAVSAAIQEGNAGLMRYLNLYHMNEERPHHNIISTTGSQELAVSFVGGMIAAEMINAEREQRREQQLEGAGPIERSFEDAESAKERIKNLGEEAVLEIMGKMPDQLIGEELTKLIATVDAEQLAREMDAAVELKADIEKDAREAAEQAEREAREAQEQAEREAREAADKPLREEQEKLNKVGLGVYTFAQKDIVPLMDKLRGALAGGQTTYSLRDSVDLLSSYVILGMIQLEELGGSSKLTRVMRDDELAKTLQVNLQMTKDFGDMLKEIATEDGNAASIEKISKVLAEKKPQELARQILTDTKFKQSLESNMKEHGIELGKGFKLGAKNEQKHEQQPVQQVPNK